MYTAEINRKQPGLLLLLIDQSFSMSEPWAGTDASKAQALADAVNNLLGNAVLLCNKGGQRVNEYFDIGIFGYGAAVGPVLHGTDVDTPVISVAQLAEDPLRVDVVSRRVPDGAGGVVSVEQHMPIWLDPASNGATPMVAALVSAEPVLRSWTHAHPTSFPPIVVNVTDGMSTDGDPRAVAERIRQFGTDDGKTLLFNLHLSGVNSATVQFPDSAERLTDPLARTLFDISSELPPALLEAAAGLHYPVRAGSRGFLFNAEATTVIDFLDIGTRSMTPQGLKELSAANDVMSQSSAARSSG